jgi:hypothetical protein
MNSAVAGLIPSLTVIEITFCEKIKPGMKHRAAKKRKDLFIKWQFAHMFFDAGCILVIYVKRG